MNSPSFSHLSVSRRRAFTLLELLVVISIIAVLAGILLPVGNSVLERSKKVSARTVMLSVTTAVKSYQTDYGVYPVEPAAAAAGAATPPDTTFATEDAAPGTDKGGYNYVLFDVLRTRNSATGSTGSVTYKALNSRRQVYFEAKDVKNVAIPRDGFIPGGAKLPPTGYKIGELVDPWGGLYCVRVDTSYSDKLKNPYPASGDWKTFSSTNGATTDADADADEKILRVPCAVWSPGKDLAFGDKSSAGNLTTACDDVASWQ